jgi:DNA invertase Pin-like site-specific DNA recombinase
VTTRAAIYARYSSDRQSDASIEDQVRLCDERGRREGYELIETYADRAVSGSSMLRPPSPTFSDSSRPATICLIP